jgi:hypothetical protein
MAISPTEAQEQAHMTAAVYARQAIKVLCGILDVDPNYPQAVREELAPFAPLLAAMVTAAADDFRTCIENNQHEERMQYRHVRGMEDAA